MALYLRGQIGRERKKKYLSLLNSAVLQAGPGRPVVVVLLGWGQRARGGSGCGCRAGRTCDVHQYDAGALARHYLPHVRPCYAAGRSVDPV